MPQIYRLKASEQNLYQLISYCHTQDRLKIYHFFGVLGFWGYLLFVSILLWKIVPAWLGLNCNLANFLQGFEVYSNDEIFFLQAYDEYYDTTCIVQASIHSMHSVHTLVCILASTRSRIRTFKAYSTRVCIRPHGLAHISTLNPP